MVLELERRGYTVKRDYPTGEWIAVREPPEEVPFGKHEFDYKTKEDCEKSLRVYTRKPTIGDC
jgi:hypothetical protein